MQLQLQLGHEGVTTSKTVQDKGEFIHSNGQIKEVTKKTIWGQKWHCGTEKFIDKVNQCLSENIWRKQLISHHQITQKTLINYLKYFKENFYFHFQ